MCFFIRCKCLFKINLSVFILLLLLFIAFMVFNEGKSLTADIATHIVGPKLKIYG